MSTIGWSGFGRTAERTSKWLMRNRLAEGSRAFCHARGPFTARLSAPVARMQRTLAADQLGMWVPRAHRWGHGHAPSHPVPLARLADAGRAGLRRRPLPRRARPPIADAARDPRGLRALHRRAHARGRGRV